MRRQTPKIDDEARLWMIERSLEIGDLEHARHDLNSWSALLARSPDAAVVARASSASETLAAKLRYEETYGRHSLLDRAAPEVLAAELYSRRVAARERHQTPA